MKIYLAGKITGDRQYEAKFRAAAVEFEKHGHIVLNPAILPEGLTDADYMSITMAMLYAADAVAFLPAFRESRGAMVEYNMCQRIGKQRFYL